MQLKNLKTKYLGRNLMYFDTIDSTQMKIKELENPINGTTVISDNQVSGIGTHERSWYTGQGKNIAMSFVLLPNCKFDLIQNITIDIAKCMIDTLNFLYKIELDIKEPNDIYCNGKKLGGILTESVCKGEQVEKIYIGIGLNVNQEEFPEELLDIATSLKIEFGRNFIREEIISEFLNKFELIFNK